MKILITESQYKKLKKHIRNQERLDEVNWSELKRSGRNLAAGAVIAGSSLLPSKGMSQSIPSSQDTTQIQSTIPKDTTKPVSVKLTKKNMYSFSPNVPKGWCEIVVHSDFDDLNFEALGGKELHVNYRNGSYFILVKPGRIGITVSIGDENILFANILAFGINADGSEPPLKEGDVYIFDIQSMGEIPEIE
jgi:hypothetical protein